MYVKYNIFVNMGYYIMKKQIFIFLIAIIIFLSGFTANASYENVNYDLEIYAESWIGEKFFKENIISALDITKALKPLSSNQIEKI